MNDNQTIAQLLNVEDFPFEIRDKNDNQIYYEEFYGYWNKTEYDENEHEIYYEDSNGRIIDNRHKNFCDNKIIEIEGKKYKLKEVK